MILSVLRKQFTKECTIGEMRIDGKFFCYTLEDTVRPNKIYGKTAIPTGTYKVIVDMSNRFKRLLPRLLEVPGFTGVRIHSGNTAEDTHGCVLVGFKRGQDTIWQSKAAENELMDVLEKDNEISISNEIPTFDEAEVARNVLKGTLDIAGAGTFEVEMKLKKIA